MSEDGAPSGGPPDLDHQPMDDANFSTTDLAKAWGLLGLPTFLLRREHKDAAAYYVENASKKVLGTVRLVENGGWEVLGPEGRLAMLWRQHTEDHSNEKLRNLVHMGFHRYEKAVHDEENASIYCLANLDRTVRMFVTYKGQDGVLDSPTNRPVLKMARGKARGDVEIVDAYDEPTANIHSEDLGYHAEVHRVTIEAAAEPFPVALFGITLGLEMDFRHGTWRSPFQHTEL